MTILFTQYTKSTLPELAEKLNINYYNIAEQLCLQAGDIYGTLKEMSEAKLENYIMLCEQLTHEVKHHIGIRKEILLPYIERLTEKIKDGHDCGTCSGKCHVGHSTSLIGIKDAHTTIKELFYQLQKTDTGIDETTEVYNFYRRLCNEISVLESTLTELFYLEEAVLIPRVEEAQRKINAHI